MREGFREIKPGVQPDWVIENWNKANPLPTYMTWSRFHTLTDKWTDPSEVQVCQVCHLFSTKLTHCPGRYPIFGIFSHQTILATPNIADASRNLTVKQLIEQSKLDFWQNQWYLDMVWFNKWYATWEESNKRRVIMTYSGQQQIAIDKSMTSSELHYGQAVTVDSDGKFHPSTVPGDEIIGRVISTTDGTIQIALDQ